MQFKSILALGLVGFSYAAPAFQAPTTIADLVSAINGIATALNAFDGSVKTLGANSDPKVALADLTSKSDAILAAIKSGTSKTNASQPVSLSEALQLTSASAALTKAAQSAIDDLIGKKDIIVKSGQTATTLKQLQDQKAATTTFIDALTSKLPAAVKSIAAQQASAATMAIQKGIKEFGGQ